jgi:hypothetical protein
VLVIGIVLMPIKMLMPIKIRVQLSAPDLHQHDADPHADPASFFICLEFILIRIGWPWISMPWMSMPIPVRQNDEDLTRSQSTYTGHMFHLPQFVIEGAEF